MSETNGKENKELENLKTLASTAKEGGNWKEAIDYYNKILELDTENYDAWFGKGLCIINTSTIGNIKMKEALSYYKNAIKFSNDENVKKIVAISINKSVNNFYPNIKNHYVRFKSTRDAQVEFATRFLALESGLAFALECNPENETIAENGLVLIRDYVSTLGSLAGIMEEILKPDEFKVKYLDAMKKINPDYEEPKAAGGCFIATATMGSYNHPAVVQLRFFRDVYLMKHKWGRIFTRVYYKYGPYPANIIAKSSLLKKVSYLLIVKPLVIITTKIKSD